jgi:hypothetical protein
VLTITLAMMGCAPHARAPSALHEVRCTVPLEEEFVPARAVLSVHPWFHQPNARLDDRTITPGSDGDIAGSAACEQAESAWNALVHARVDPRPYLGDLRPQVAPASDDFVVAVSRVGFDASCSTAFFSLVVTRSLPGEVDRSAHAEYRCLMRGGEGWAVVEESIRRFR